MTKSKAQLESEIDAVVAGGGASASKEQTSSDAPSLRVGQKFDHFGHIYEITKIGRDKNRTVQIARRHRDPFGKEAFIDHRSFPARHLDQHCA